MKEKRFKQTEIGLIPDDWEINRIVNITDIYSGGTPDTNNTTYWGGNIPWMSSGKLNKKFIYDVIGRITESGLNNSSTHWIPKECILIGLAGQGKTRGTAAINFIPLCTNQSIVAIYPFDKFVSTYIYYYIGSIYDYLRKISDGRGGRGGLTKTLIGNLHIPLPNTKEQNKIASVLTSIDNLLLSLDKLLEKKRLIKQGVMQKLLMGKKRLPGFTGEWVEKKSGEGLRFKPGFPFNSNFFDVRMVIRLIRNRDLKADDQITYFYGDINKDFIIENGDLLIGMDGDFMPCLWNKGKALLNQRVGKIKLISNNWCLMYLYYALQEPLKAKQEKTGATTVKHLSHSDIEQMRLKMPSTSIEQKVIGKILSSMDKEIESLEGKKAKYEQIKQGIMQLLLTGKIRLIS